MSSYTQRFILAGPPGGTRTYVVPAGYRIVVRCISVTVQGVVTDGGAVYMNSVLIWYWASPAATAGRFDILYAALYAGEELALATWGADTNGQITGYIFQDPDGPIGRQQLDLERPGPLPAGGPV